MKGGTIAADLIGVRISTANYAVQRFIGTTGLGAVPVPLIR